MAFNEDSRVKIPAILHFVRLGYTYIPQSQQNRRGISIHSKIQSNLIQNQELTSLRDWLLPMLMNGQVTVADAEEMVEEKLGMVAEERGRYGKGEV